MPNDSLRVSHVSRCPHQRPQQGRNFVRQVHTWGHIYLRLDTLSCSTSAWWYPTPAPSRRCRRLTYCCGSCGPPEKSCWCYAIVWPSVRSQKTSPLSWSATPRTTNRRLPMDWVLRSCTRCRSTVEALRLSTLAVMIDTCVGASLPDRAPSLPPASRPGQPQHRRRQRCGLRIAEYSGRPAAGATSTTAFVPR